MLAGALQTTTAAEDAPSRRARWAAVCLDAAAGLAAALAAGVLAAAWLLVRTDGGARDVGSGDAAFAFALLMAAVPAWLGWLAVDLVTRGATPGERARGLTVALDSQGTPARRVLRLAAHPLGVVGWLWLTAVATLATAPVLPLLFASVSVVALVAALASAVLALLPGAPAGIHDHIAGTQLRRAPAAGETAAREASR